MKRAFSVDNVFSAKFSVIPFDGDWKDGFGCPELAGTWINYGRVKNGKTDFTMKLSKYMTNFGRVLYNSVEEGLSLSIQEAYSRNNMKDVAGKFILSNKESFEEIIERLNRHKSPNIIVIDTVQFWEISFKQYKQLKAMFPQKLFIYVSHEKGSLPEGSVAQKIYRDANIATRIEGFRAFPVGRYGGGEYINISKEKAEKYWFLKQ